MNFINIQTNQQFLEKWNESNYSIFLFYQEDCSSCQNLINSLLRYSDYFCYKVNYDILEEEFDKLKIESVPHLFIVKDSKIYFEMGINYMNLETFFSRYIYLSNGK